MRKTSRRFARVYVSTGTSRERPLPSRTGSLPAEKSAFPKRIQKSTDDVLSIPVRCGSKRVTATR